MNLYDELRGGASAEELVAAFTAQLNEAECRIKAEDEAEAMRLAAEQAEKEALAKSKREDLADAMAGLMSALGKHYPDLLEGTEELSDEELYALADLVIMLLDLESLKPKSKRKVTPKITKSNDDVFASFFKTFGL